VSSKIWLVRVFGGVVVPVLCVLCVVRVTCVLFLKYGIRVFRSCVRWCGGSCVVCVVRVTCVLFKNMASEGWVPSF